MPARPFVIVALPVAVLAFGSLSLLLSQTSRASRPTARPQAKSSASAPKPSNFRTPWGDPDLQGVWNNGNSTPLERPSELGGKTVLSDAEAEEFQEHLTESLSRDRRDGSAETDVERAYGEEWMDSHRFNVSRRTSLIVDPPDGRIPKTVPLSAEQQKHRNELAAALARVADGLPNTYTDFVLPIRCIMRRDIPPYMPGVYNNDFQIVQSPGYVVIGPEMIHTARIIPVAGRPHLRSDLKQWFGDPRGHWEGNTLVVETTNFSPEFDIFQNADPATFKLTERFTRVDAKTIAYEFTVSDPHTWTSPWTASMPWNRVDPAEQMYEYACHEDNYDVIHFLKGAREREARGDVPQPAAHPPANQ